MKNIHVLPTDKPSRLYLVKDILKLSPLKFKNDEEVGWFTQNIYITSDEEIKEGDWFITTDTNEIHKSDWIKFHFDNGKKIILTTDQDLIKDGVQAIDDEFLEWFVKNSSCENVEIINEIQSYKSNRSEKWIYEYKIIIPKEEPKQETLEEVAEKHSNEMFSKNGDLNAIAHTSFIKGAKWQQEQDKNKYSEEDLKKAFFSGCFSERQIKPRIDCWKEWFKQFKNK